MIEFDGPDDRAMFWLIIVVDILIVVGVLTFFFMAVTNERW